MSALKLVVALAFVLGAATGFAVVVWPTPQAPAASVASGANPQPAPQATPLQSPPTPLPQMGGPACYFGSPPLVAIPLSPMPTGQWVGAQGGTVVLCTPIAGGWSITVQGGRCQGSGGGGASPTPVGDGFTTSFINQTANSPHQREPFTVR